MIDICDVSLAIKKHKILDHVNLTVNRGEICGLIGRNGSGKTMLMKCMCGFILPTEGTIYIGGKQIGKDVEFPAHTGIIIETPGFLSRKSGYANLTYLADLSGGATQERIKECMDLVGLDWKSKLPVRGYSLGMKQRLGLAQAMMESPELLVLDEPFNAMDKEGVKDMRSYLLKLKEKGVTIVLTSHVMEDIDCLCDRVYEMDHGRINEYFLEGVR